MSIKIVLILAIFIYASVQANQLLDGLSDAQIRRIFHRSRDELPNYKTATLKTSTNHRSKRELRTVELEVDGKKTQLNLRPPKYNSFPRDVPVWTVETDNGTFTGQKFNKINQDQAKYDGILYEDNKKMATLIAYYKDGNMFYDGIVGEGYQTRVVRSVPETWWRAPGNESYDDHVVFDADQHNSKTEIIGESDGVSNADKLKKPLEVLYPKLLLIIEYNYFKALSEDISETIKYAAIFWNAVNLKYSKLNSPKVNVVITGVIIAKDDTALEYIYAARNESDMSSIDHIALLISQSVYFLGQFNDEVDFKNYDATITMTGLSAGPVAGSAFPGKICSSHLNVAWVHDDTSLSGIVVATHELGHLLNLPHDGEELAKACGPQDKIATIMAPVRTFVDEYVWSECSKKIIQDFASTKASECMRYPYRRRIALV